MDSNRHTRETTPAIPATLRERTTVLGELQQTLATLLENHIDLKYQNYLLHKRCEALEQSNIEYEELYNHAPIGYTILTANGDIHNINTTGAHILWQQRAHLIGKPFSSLLAHADKEAFAKHLQCAQQQQHAITVRVRREHNTVALRIVSVAAQRASPSALYIRSVLLDTTQFRQAQSDTALPDVHLHLASTHALPPTPLEQELEQKEKDLTVLALQCLEKQEQFTVLAQQLKKASRVSPSQSRQLIHTMLCDIRESLEQPTTWQWAEQHLGKGTRHFLGVLARNYPHLTPTELKICNLIRLAMSTKEIASILHTSPKTIENQRYRIRKKLGLSLKQHLVSFLMAL